MASADPHTRRATAPPGAAGDRRRRTGEAQGRAGAGGRCRRPGLAGRAVSGGCRLRHARTARLRSASTCRTCSARSCSTPRRSGRPKAEAGRERLAALNPEIRVIAHAAGTHGRQRARAHRAVRPGARWLRPPRDALPRQRCLRAAAPAAGVGGDPPLRGSAHDLRAGARAVLPLRCSRTPRTAWSPTARRRACSGCCRACWARCRRPRRSS